MSQFPVRSVKVSAYVPAPPTELFAFVADTRNDPLWCPNVETVEVLSDGPIQVGSRFRFHQHLDRPGAKRVEFDVDTEVIDLDDLSITWRITDRFQERLIAMSVKPEDQGSRVTQITEASFRRPPGFVRWVYPIVARRTFQRQFKELAAHFAARQEKK